MNFILFLCFIAISMMVGVNAVVTSQETSWLAANPPLVPEEDLAAKAVRRTEFDSHGETDVNLFRTFWKYVQGHPSATWNDFTASSEKQTYDSIQAIKAQLDAAGYTDPKWHESFFVWSSETSSQSISRWIVSTNFHDTETYLSVRNSMRQAGRDDYQFGYYWSWLQTNPQGTITQWESSQSHHDMWTREYMRQELATEMGYTDNVYFRHCWRWHELHPHSWIHDWEATHDHDVLKYREEKRTELIALGHRDKEQFNRFWAWISASPYYDGPSLTSELPATPSEVWYTTGDLVNTNNAQQNTEQKCVNLNAGDSARFTVCSDTFVRNDYSTWNVLGDFTGDPYLRLVNGPSGGQVSYNDDWCGLGSEISFTAPTAGSYCLNMGCYSSRACQYGIRLFINEIM